MQKGFVPLFIFFAVIISALFAAAAIKTIKHTEISLAPTVIPTSTPSPSPEPSISPLPNSTTVPQNGSLYFDNGNSKIRVENSGTTSKVEVSTSGNGSADVSVHQDLHSNQSVQYSLGIR